MLPSPAALRRKIIIKNKKKHHHHKKGHGTTRSSTAESVTEITGNGDIPHAPPLQTRQGSKDSQNEDDDNGEYRNWVYCLKIESLHHDIYFFNIRILTWCVGGGVFKNPLDDSFLPSIHCHLPICLLVFARFCYFSSIS